MLKLYPLHKGRRLRFAYNFDFFDELGQKAAIVTGTEYLH